MKWTRLQTSLAMIACCGFLLPSTCLYGQQPVGQSTPTKTLDVELTSEGALQGTVVTSTGSVLSAAPVFLRQGTEIVAQTTANAEGNFRFAAVPGGVFNLVAAGKLTNIRVWSPNTAPPHAVAGALIVAGDVTRGQCTTESCTGTCGGVCRGAGGGGIAGSPMGLLMNPFVIGAAVAAAIAIPLALQDNNKDDAS